MKGVSGSRQKRFIYIIAGVLALVLLCAGGIKFKIFKNVAKSGPNSKNTIGNPGGKAVFKVDGTRIIGPDGKEFIAKGTNINGLNCWWNREVTQDAALIGDVWKFNSVRVNCVLKPEIFYKGGSGSFVNNNIDKIVKTFTDRKIVVMLEAHDWTGSYPTAASNPSLMDLQNWYKSLAKKYKDNPYVWYNIMNEPGQGKLNPQWKPAHEAVIKTIRSQGANNIIVLDGHGYASELGESDTGMITEKDSAILSYGQELAKKYGNLVFSVHMYSWTGPKAKFEDFVDKVHAKGLALIMGEYGAIKGNGRLTSSAETVKTTLQIAAEKKIGWLHWAWQGADGYCLTDEHTQQAGGWEIDRKDGEKPSNLSWMGEKIWNDTHGIAQSFENTDLAVKDIILDRQDFKPGDEVQVQAMIKNLGDLKIPSTAKGLLRLYMDDKEIGASEFKGPLGLQQFKSIIFPKFKVASDKFTLKAVIDESSSYGSDSDTSNNSKTIDFNTTVQSEAELAITKLRVLPEKEIYNPGDKVTFAVTITNIGTKTADYDSLGGVFLVDGDKAAVVKSGAFIKPGKSMVLTTTTEYEIKSSCTLSFKFYNEQKITGENQNKSNDSLFITIKCSVAAESMNLLNNPGFELGEQGWQAWGGNEIVTGDVHNGTKAWKIKSGNTGGGGQELVLEPDTAYKFEAWGKIKGNGGADVGIKYQLPDGSWTYNTLNFIEEEYTHKEVEFTTPEEFQGAILFIWKGSKDNELYVDDLSVTLNNR